jgi:signal transduction histidine kinase
LFSSGGTVERTFALALKYVRQELQAEAASLFLFDEERGALTWWALDGGAEQLRSAVLPADKGIVGWVVARQEAVISNNPAEDKRFNSQVDENTAFRTRNLICVPLCGSGSEKLGALQFLNKSEAGFSQEDLSLLECIAPQFVLGMQNTLRGERLREAHAKLAALQKRRDDMLSVLSHEFRTPLGIIQASGDLLARGNLPPSQLKKTSEKLSDGVQRLLRLVAGVRNAAVVRNSEVQVQNGVFSLSDITSGIVSQLSEATRAVRNLTFEDKIQPKLLVAGDDVLIGLALSNLLHNAIRFTPDGGRIRVAASESLGVVSLEVSDTGIGIAEHQRGAIFEKFYEVGDMLAHSSGSLSFKSGGIGLGLSTVKSILDAHRASLEVESGKGGGSTFRIRLRAATK